MHRSATDRRRQVWRTTAAGETLLREIAGQLDALAETIQGGLSMMEQQVIQSLCQRLVEAIGTQARRYSGQAPRGDEQDEQRASKEAA